MAEKLLSAETLTVQCMLQTFDVPELKMFLRYANQKISTHNKFKLLEEASLLISRRSYKYNLYVRSLYTSIESKFKAPSTRQSFKNNLEDIQVLKGLKLNTYDDETQLIPPTILLQQDDAIYNSEKLSFTLSPKQATEISSSRNDQLNHIELRFTQLDTEPSNQAHYFPSYLHINVNKKPVNLPSPVPVIINEMPLREGVETVMQPHEKPTVGIVQQLQRPALPINITSFCKLSPLVANEIDVTWASDEDGERYTLAVYLICRVPSHKLLERLREREVRSVENTRSLIENTFSECASMDPTIAFVKVSLVCPLGLTRMNLPCRGTQCGHLECFDGSLFLQMNELTPKWICPICHETIPYQDLVVDGYFSEVLSCKELPLYCNEIFVDSKGDWSPVEGKEFSEISVIDIADAEEHNSSRPNRPSTPASNGLQVSGPKLTPASFASVNQKDVFPPLDEQKKKNDHSHLTDAATDGIKWNSAIQLASVNRLSRPSRK